MARSWVVGTLFLVLLACGDDGPTEPAGPELSFLSLFPTETVALVEDRIELEVTARDLSGAELTDFVPAYTSLNPSVVRIEPGPLIVASSPGTATVRASAGGQTADVAVHVGAASYDLGALGPPRVLTANYIDLSKIERISRFRSGIGHDYSFAHETCRSMKHYYKPMDAVDWASVDVYAPATGTIQGIRSDGGWGYQIRMAPRDLPWLSVMLFHVEVDPGIVRGTWVEAGDHLGKHATASTMSDIAMSLGSIETGTLLSYFETMTDGVFAEYQARGVASRAAAIITKEERDADPLDCTGQSQFPDPGTIENWLDLN